MAIKELDIWAKELVLDIETNSEQRRNLNPEEYENGWLYRDEVSAQQMNSLFYLITLHSKSVSQSPELIPSTATIPTISLEWVDGGTIDEVAHPELYAYYGSTFPTLQSTAPSGWKYIVRKM